MTFKERPGETQDTYQPTAVRGLCLCLTNHKLKKPPRFQGGGGKGRLGGHDDDMQGLLLVCDGGMRFGVYFKGRCSLFRDSY